MADIRSYSRTAPPSIRDRRALRITPLSLAVAILLLGAAAYGYTTLSHPSAASAPGAGAPGASAPGAGERPSPPQDPKTLILAETTTLIAV
jgi:hypothetical protein